MQIYDIPIDSSQQETTRHGSFELPMAVYETELRKNVLGFVDWHWHQEFQFCLATAGETEFYVQRQRFCLRPGQGLFINSNVLHMARPLTGDAAYCCVDVLPKLLGSFSGSLLDVALVTPLSRDTAFPCVCFPGDTPEAQRACDLLERVRALLCEKPVAYQLSVTGHLMALLQLILALRQRQGVPANPEDLSRLRQVLRFIGEHYGEKLTLSQCAAQVGLCPSEFCRYFKSVMHTPLMPYIRGVRISKAASALLLHPEKSVSQIAYETGFSTTSYFISQFHAATGETPAAYRQRKL